MKMRPMAINPNLKNHDKVRRLYMHINSKIYKIKRVKLEKYNN